MSLLRPARPGEAFDAFMAARAGRHRQDSVWQPGSAPMPTLYLSHGAPPVFDDPHWIGQLSRWATELPKPTAILIVSAHWESAPIALSSPAAATPLVYDFAGFAPRYSTMTYPTPDAGRLADRVQAMLPAAEQVHVHPSRGLDHGAWVPLKVMYPDADVPTIQLSLPTHHPERLLRLGRRLRPLRDEGVLVVGSGFMTHGLRHISFEVMEHNLVPGWSAEFDAWVAEALDAGDLDAICGFRDAPGMPYAHPTVEHFTPLFVTMGAATDAATDFVSVIDDFQFGLAKRSLQFA